MFNPIRILLVDDSPYFLDAAREFISLQESFQVAGAVTGGEDALAQALQLHPDVILLDMNLGEQSGLDLIPFFKKNLPETKIIVLTIMTDESYRKAAMQTGADAFVSKSDMTDTLFSTIIGLVDVSAGNQGPSDKTDIIFSGKNERYLF